MKKAIITLALAAFALGLTPSGIEAETVKKDACTELLIQLVGVQASYRDMDFRLNLFGCDEPEPTRMYIHHQPEACPKAANKVANKLVNEGKSAINITTRDIGRKIGGRGTVVKGYDCTLFEDWSWG